MPVARHAASARRAARICTVQIFAAGFALSLLSVVGPARAQPLPPEYQRTVEWYASHPSERTQVRRICLNDPGHLAQSPDCINAKKGDLIAAAGPSRRGSAGVDMSDPDSPEYWSKRPNDRTLKLGYCRRMSPQQQQSAGCAPAQQSFLMEQQGSGRR